MTKEVWKDIKGFEGVYQVSNLGNVKSLDRYLPYKTNGSKFYKGQEIVKRPNNCGYLRVGLSKNKKQHHYFVHRLVAQTFIENFNNLEQVNHKDGNKLNNRVDNLEWVTLEDNISHSIETGLRKCKGSDNNYSKLTEEEVVVIKKRILSEEETLTEIAKDFNISISVVSCIKLGKSWKHVRL